MAPRRKKSPTSDIAQDAERRLDATAGKPEPVLDAPATDVSAEPAPASEAAPAPEPVLELTPSMAEPDPKPEPDPVPEPKSSQPEPQAKAAPEVAVKPSPRAGEAPPVRTARLLAGDHPRSPNASRRGRRTLVALLAAAVVAGLAWTGILAPFLPFGRTAGEGASPPPRISDSAQAGRDIPAEPTPVARAREDGALAGEMRALKDSLEQADAESAKRLDDLAQRVEKLEKEQAAKIADLTARLDRAEQNASAGQGSQTAAASAPSAPAQAAAQDGAGTAPATDGDPVTASTGGLDAAGNPLPQPRPSDIGNITVARPSAASAGPERTAPASPVLRDWVLRDVYGGVALIEGRWGMIEVVQGSVLPGGGVVQNIRRAGNRWVVTTTRGIISAGR